MNPMDQMFQTFGQMMCMPMTMFSETVTRTMREWQPAMCAPASSCGPAPCSPCEIKACEVKAPVRGWDSCDSGTWGGAWESRNCCGRCGESPCRCSGGGSRCSTTVKLIEFSLVSVGRWVDSHSPTGGVLWHDQWLVNDCTSEEEFRNMVIVAYMQRHNCPKVDGKNLRVSTRVLGSWCKPEFCWEEEQIQALHGIKHALDPKRC